MIQFTIKTVIGLVLSVILCHSEGFSELKAFPTAEGYGRLAKGGRGGRVIEVTNLSDAGSGSLRDAVDATGPRTIVFSISGVINLKSKLLITGTKNNGYVTIAGQTAPGKGICISGWTVGMIGGEHVIIRHIRTRIGTSSGETMDGMGMASGNFAIFDHCSISWTIDEAFSSRSAKNITLQRTLISEALNEAGHSYYPAGTQHGYAASISGDIGSFHYNLLAHCAGRNWSLAGGLGKNPSEFAGRLDIRNNVVYNWRSRTTDGGAHEVNFVNNYYKPGPAVTIKVALNAQIENFPGTQSYYFSGNVMPGYFDESNQEKGRTISYVNRDKSSVTWNVFVDKPFFESYVNNLEMYLNELAGDPMPWETGPMTLRKAAEPLSRFLLTARGLSINLPVGACVRIERFDMTGRGLEILYDGDMDEENMIVPFKRHGKKAAGIHLLRVIENERKTAASMIMVQ